jgi:hypothetical protein
MPRTVSALRHNMNETMQSTMAAPSDAVSAPPNMILTNEVEP